MSLTDIIVLIVSILLIVLVVFFKFIFPIILKNTHKKRNMKNKGCCK